VSADEQLNEGRTAAESRTFRCSLQRCLRLSIGPLYIKPRAAMPVPAAPDRDHLPYRRTPR